MPEAAAPLMAKGVLIPIESYVKMPDSRNKHSYSLVQKKDNLNT